MKNTLNILLFLLAGTLVSDNCDAFHGRTTKKSQTQQQSFNQQTPEVQQAQHPHVQLAPDPAASTNIQQPVANLQIDSDEFNQDIFNERKRGKDTRRKNTRRKNVAHDAFKKNKPFTKWKGYDWEDEEEVLAYDADEERLIYEQDEDAWRQYGDEWISAEKAERIAAEKVKEEKKLKAKEDRRKKKEEEKEQSRAAKVNRLLMNGSVQGDIK